MKNVCFFNSTKFFGGGEKSHLEYAVNFRQRNYKVFVITSSGSALEQKAKELNIPVFGFSIGNRSFLNPLKIKRLANFFMKNQIDTVFLNSSPDLKLGGLAAKKAGVKNIVYMRGLAVPVKNSLLNRYLLGKVVTHPVPNSRDTRKMFLTHLTSFLDESKVPVIYRGINFEAWNERPVETLHFREKDEVIIGNVGRLVKQKGQGFLIDLTLKLKACDLDFKLMIAGVGPLEEELKKRIQKEKLEDYIFLPGFFPNIKSFLNAIDIFVFPSLWEGFGNAMVEAMAEEKPVVAFNLTSNPEIVTSGKDGFLIDYPNVDDFAETILKLAKDPALRKRIGENARISVTKRFSFDQIMDEWEKLLD